ncbi:unnamed protein product [Phytophthora lilii]|uniref:Unnamed protein product n=1 Tax=Phytophthora lilii TaxID=2077276 RepID=A0A9W6WG52_9STRA|nr:unnamed protein product [Phytophthora lilii]
MIAAAVTLTLMISPAVIALRRESRANTSISASSNITQDVDQEMIDMEERSTERLEVRPHHLNTVNTAEVSEDHAHGLTRENHTAEAPIRD